MFKKFFIGLSLTLLVSSLAFSKVYSSQALIPANDWVYDALNTLCMETKFVNIADNAPCSVQELRFYLGTVDYDKLSDEGKVLYDQIKTYLTEEEFKLNLNPVKIGLNLKLNPTVLAHTNSNIDWSMNTSYSGQNLLSISGKYPQKSQLKDFQPSATDGDAVSFMKDGYADSSSYTNSEFTNPLVQVPFVMDFSDVFIIQTEVDLGLSQFGLFKNDYFNNNMALNGHDMDFYWPETANASFGHVFEKGWGFNIHAARSGLQLGRSQTGSIMYNSTFNTDFYFQGSVYSRRLKYQLDVAEISHADNQDRFLYLHHFEVLPFKWFKFTFTEATMMNDSFSLRYLNPFMVFHSFGTWTQTAQPWEDTVYGETKTCAYMCLSVDFTPFKGGRIYILYAQDEMQPPSELTDNAGRSIPDGWGYQLGFELNKPSKNGGWYIFGIEGVYTNPFLYIKQNRDCSLISYRYNMQSNGSTPICSWIGTPFGPDAVGIQTKFGYEKTNKWKIEGDYLFVAHGTNGFGLFSNYDVYTDEYGNTYIYNCYYPAVRYNVSQTSSSSSTSLSASDAESIARNLGLTGTVQFTNQAAIKGSYTFNEHFKMTAQLMYEFIFNNNNNAGAFEQGFELALASEIKLF